MPLSLINFSLVEAPVTVKEALPILERDDYRCRYCGLDGRETFENALMMTVDFVMPRARKGKKTPENLVACCKPCNAIKGTKVYSSIDEARAHVLATREKLRQSWEEKTARPKAKTMAARV